MLMTESYNNVIEFKDVSFSYSDHLVIESASFALHKSESVALVGPNGGGKSTIIKLILGLLKPQKGEVSVLGTTPAAARMRIGYMPQFLSYDSKFPISVKDVVITARIAGKFFGFYSKQDNECAIAGLEKMRVAHLADRQFSDLSGGERQRVMIARALACEPEILLLDEPTANVDPAVEEEFNLILQKLTSDMTIVTVSHDLGFVGRIVDHVICVNRQIQIHPTTALTGDLISEIYGSKMHMVRHDHNCSDHDGHGCAKI
jgi:zinc transport system ATP-binding protein